MSDEKTYFLAPDHKYPPDDRIELGNIITHPFRPHTKLCSFEIQDDAKGTLRDETRYNFDDDKDRNVRAGFWARFIQFAGGSGKAAKAQRKSRHYIIDCLHTSYLRVIPNEEQLRPYLDRACVKTALKSGRFKHKPPLYLISGLKIAYGLSWCEGKDHAVCASADAGATVTPDGTASTGGNAGLNRHHCQHNSSRITGPRIFAYELQIIREKKNSIEIEEYTKGALLHDRKIANDESCASEIENIDVEAVKVKDSAGNPMEDYFEDFDEEDGGFWVLDTQ